MLFFFYYYYFVIIILSEVQRNLAVIKQLPPLPLPVSNPTVVERPCRHFGVCPLAHTSLKLAHDIVKLDHATGRRTRIIQLAHRVDHNATSKDTFPLRQHNICQLAHNTTPERV